MQIHLWYFTTSENNNIDFFFTFIPKNQLTANNCIKFCPGVYKEAWAPIDYFSPRPLKKSMTPGRKGHLVFGWLIWSLTPLVSLLGIGYSLNPGLHMNGVLTKLWIFWYQRGQEFGQENRWFTILGLWSSLSNSWTIVALSKLWHSHYVKEYNIFLVSISAEN